MTEPSWPRRHRPTLPYTFNTPDTPRHGGAHGSTITPRTTRLTDDPSEHLHTLGETIHRGIKEGA